MAVQLTALAIDLARAFLSLPTPQMVLVGLLDIVLLLAGSNWLKLAVAQELHALEWALMTCRWYLWPK